MSPIIFYIAEYKTGDIEYYWGHYVAALEKFRSSIRMFEEHPVHQSGGLSFVGAGSPAYYLFWSYGKAAMAGLYAGKVDEILANVQSAYAVSERFASANSNDTLAKRNLAMSHLLMCEGARLHGTYREALDQCRTAASSLESIVATEHDNSRWQRDLGWAKIDLGAVLMRRGSLEEAAAAFRSAVSINEQLVASDPKNMLWHSYLAGANLGLAQSLVWLKKLDDALSNCRAVAALADPFASDERNYKFRRFLAWSRLCVGDVRKAQSDFEEALKSYRDGFALLQGLAHLDPVGAIRKSDLAWAYDKIGDALSARGRGGEALDSYRMATTLAQQIAGADPNNADWEWVLLWSEWRRAEHGDEAAASLGDIVARIRKLKSEDRLSADLAWLLPMAEARLAKLSGE